MRRTRRHKFIEISVFFLIYSIIHVLSENSSYAEKTTPSTLIQETKKLTNGNTTILVKPSSNNIKESRFVTKNDSAPCTPPAIQQSRRRRRQTPFRKERYFTDWIEKMHNTYHKNEELITTAQTITTPPVTPKSEVSVTTTSTLSSTKHVTPAVTTTSTPSFTHVTPAKNSSELNDTEPTCNTPAVNQFPKPMIGPDARKHGAIIVHIIVAVYTFLGLAIVCDEYFVASLDRICEELKMSPDVAGATFMAAGSSAPELATVVIGVFFAKDDIGISGVIGSAVFNIMFVISVCALCTTTAIALNWWPLIRDCFFYAVSILVMLITIEDKQISWKESLAMILMYVVYCVVLHYNDILERWAQTLPVPCKKVVNEQSGLVTYKTLEQETGKRQGYDGCSREESFENGIESGISNHLSGPDLNQVAETGPTVPPQRGYYKSKDFDPSKTIDRLAKPIEGTAFTLAVWYTLFPIHYLCKKTMPDCRLEQYRNWYPFTFLMSMLWISFYSYFMVWMITIIGTTLGIPDTVMGLTFVAAGVSVPDALSSMAVIKEGYGDMAVSNAVGSNVFDILICLGLPWFIKTAIIKPGSKVKVFSKGLTYSTLSLLSTVVFLVGATHLNGWKLDRKYGIILMAWYLIFITFASMYELNVFGYLNPPECSTKY